MRSKIVLTAFVVFGFVLAGCNTVAGMGKDIQTGGQKLENAADSTKQKM